jgi:nucleoside-diphosphate-sugar epimerase
MSMKVLITGASGFVGKNLTSYLKRIGIDFVILDRNELKKPSAAHLNNCNTIIHLAGKAHDLKNNSAEDEYIEVNYGYTQGLYSLFLQSNAKKFIYMSSVKATADTTSGSLTEENVSDPRTSYGRSKQLAEQYILNANLPQDKSYFILRPCMIHGPGNKGNLNLLFKLVKSGIPYPLAAFNNQRSFLSVENLCFVLNELIMRTDIPSGIYNIADDESCSTNEVISVISTVLNRKPRLWKVSPLLIKTLAKVGDWLHLPFTTERVQKLTESYLVDNTKLKKTLAKDLPISCKAGLKLTAQHFSTTN